MLQKENSLSTDNIINWSTGIQKLADLLAHHIFLKHVKNESKDESTDLF